MGKRWCEKGMVGGKRAKVKWKENQVKGKNIYIDREREEGMERKERETDLLAGYQETIIRLVQK